MRKMPKHITFSPEHITFRLKILNCPFNTSLEMSEFWTFPPSLLYSSSAPSQLMAPWSLPGAHAKSLSTILDSSFKKKKKN